MNTLPHIHSLPSSDSQALAARRQATFWALIYEGLQLPATQLMGFAQAVLHVVRTTGQTG